METENPESTTPDPSWVASAIFWLVLAACTVVPWALQAVVGWWAGLLSIPLLFMLYDVLFVPRGSICMGIPFVIPLSSAMGLVALNVMVLLKWLFRTYWSG